ncbi:hypothetical protein KVR801_200189 [Klebsiella variicola]|nr:hypothetical protein KVR801_200189 [Klebsiella variicola]
MIISEGYLHPSIELLQFNASHNKPFVIFVIGFKI